MDDAAEGSRAIELTIRPISPEHETATARAAETEASDLDAWLHNLDTATHPWAGRSVTELRRARGAPRKRDAWWFTLPVLGCLAAVGHFARRYNEAMNTLPTFAGRDCGAYDACLQVETSSVDTLHEHTNVFTGSSESWTETVRSVVRNGLPELAIFPGSDAWPASVRTAMETSGGAWLERCLAALDSCLAADAERRVAFAHQRDFQIAQLSRERMINSVGVVFGFAAASCVLLGVIVLCRRERPRLLDAPPRARQVESDVTSHPQASPDDIAASAAALQSVADEQGLIEHLRTLPPATRREALLENRARLARGLLARAEERDSPLLLHHVRAALAEAHAHASPARQRQISGILSTHDLPNVSLEAWHRGQPRLAAEAVAGRWKSLDEYVSRFPSIPQEVKRKLLQSTENPLTFARILNMQPEAILQTLDAQHPARFRVAACLEPEKAEAFAETHGLPIALLRPDSFQHSKPLPAELIRFVTRFTSASELLAWVPMPNDPNLREDYALRLVAAWAVRPAKTKLATEPQATCVICFDELESNASKTSPASPAGTIKSSTSAVKQPVGLRLCNHPPASHAECLTAWVAPRIATHICSCPVCRQPMAPDDLLELGQTPQVVTQYAKKLIDQETRSAILDPWLSRTSRAAP